MHHLALDSDPPAMDDADLVEASLDGLIKVFLYNDLNLARLKCMQVERVFDRNLVHSIQYTCRL